jgi:hypothetical protein
MYHVDFAQYPTVLDVHLLVHKSIISDTHILPNTDGITETGVAVTLH